MSLRGDIARWWRAAAAVAIGVALLLVGWFAWKAISKPTDTEPLTEAANVPNDASSLVVRLRPEKLAAAGIRTVAVERRVIQETRRVPGKIGYNASKRLDIKLPASGVVKQVLALPGEQIAHGQPLARLTSIEVGLARDEVIKSEADVQLAAYEFNWAKEIAGNLNSLLAMLEGRPDVSDVEEKFKNKLL
ncbi:MAG TPA: hypothetical protein VG713_12565, partial [Pirellulales bacterium]|nr:hypothetical protein [Pirellulales bacterium]